MGKPGPVPQFRSIHYAAKIENGVGNIRLPLEVSLFRSDTRLLLPFMQTMKDPSAAQLSYLYVRPSAYAGVALSRNATEVVARSRVSALQFANKFTR